MLRDWCGGFSKTNAALFCSHLGNEVKLTFGTSWLIVVVVVLYSRRRYHDPFLTSKPVALPVGGESPTSTSIVRDRKQRIYLFLARLSIARTEPLGRNRPIARHVRPTRQATCSVACKLRPWCRLANRVGELFGHQPYPKGRLKSGP